MNAIFESNTGKKWFTIFSKNFGVLEIPYLLRRPLNIKALISSIRVIASIIMSYDSQAIWHVL